MVVVVYPGERETFTEEALQPFFANLFPSDAQS